MKDSDSKENYCKNILLYIYFILNILNILLSIFYLIFNNYVAKITLYCTSNFEHSAVYSLGEIQSRLKTFSKHSNAINTA